MFPLSPPKDLLHMFLRLLMGSLFVIIASAWPLHAQEEQSSAAAKPSSIRILLITGGCCHDYDFQTKAMQSAVKEAGIEAEWKVVNEGGRGTEAQIELYDNPDWAKGFDVVIHNECFADTNDPTYIRKITDVHKSGVNAVVIHCAMHTYRSASIDDWREFLGVTSKRHDHQSHYPVRKLIRRIQLLCIFLKITNRRWMSFTSSTKSGLMRLLWHIPKAKEMENSIQFSGLTSLVKLECLALRMVTQMRLHRQGVPKDASRGYSLVSFRRHMTLAELQLLLRGFFGKLIQFRKCKLRIQHSNLDAVIGGAYSCRIDCKSGHIPSSIERGLINGDRLRFFKKCC